VDHLLLRALGAQRDRPPEDLSACRQRRPRPLRALIPLLSFALLLAGCGGGDDEGGGGAELPSAGGGGTIAYALPALPAAIDPLAATDRSSQTITRQIYEPLSARLVGPYDDAAVRPGLALAAEPSPNNSVWTLTLRTGVRFQDGTPFNATAVQANARRWTTLPKGRALLPGVFAVDAPRPDQVRFLLDAPDPGLAKRLASPQLGIVSPQALSPQGGAGARLRTTEGAGTGPFELRAVSPTRIELDRNPRWWGSPMGLGPALDAVAFLGEPLPGRRLTLLEGGAIQVADALGRRALAAAARDPLLTTLGGPALGIGIERSVRGLDSARAVPVLSGVWLTDIG
jgi:peptide/nickel transport system substrate-binding protein